MTRTDLKPWSNDEDGIRSGDTPLKLSHHANVRTFNSRLISHALEFLSMWVSSRVKYDTEAKYLHIGIAWNFGEGRVCQLSYSSSPDYGSKSRGPS
ncbi:hypothetical protein AVEN_228108-1 [Araneus ventricosus]|uniref:Uncharacterized protein n=1 Tax=Araneus ventricosus TaxID=182803 RepID=A0A4Y2HRI0_ARAVE|nr:hypothetical protein AVEN_228108-1 [Araneus ventricosus]